MGVALGLAAATSWGCADYVAARAARAIGSIRVVVGFHVVATALLAVLVLATGTLERVGLDDLPLFIVIGALGWLSYASFYAALKVGPISIVSPIVSGYAAVTLLLAVTVLGERLARAEVVAIIVVMAGVALAAFDLRQVLSSARVPVLGVALALLTMIVIGTFVFGVAYRANDLGWLAPIFLARAASLLFLLGHARSIRVLDLADRRPRVLGAIVVLAVLDTAGYVFFNVGATRADTAIVAAASAPYAAIPVVAGVLFFHERPAPIQWAGIALVLGGVVLLGLGSD
jgi:drug/metabolite transporter (DMT)-like permease